MDKELKLVASASTIQLLNKCKEDSIYGSDAINIPSLMGAIIDSDEAALRGYLLKKKIEIHELENFMQLIKGNRSSLLIDGKNAESEPIFHSELDYYLILLSEDKKEYKYPCSEEMSEVINEIIKMASEAQFNKIEPIHFVISLFRIDDKTLKEYFKDLEVDYEKAKKFFTRLTQNNSKIIPYEMSNFLRVINDSIDPKEPCRILGRDREIKRLWTILSKEEKANPILVGEDGVGKMALVEAIAYDIVSGRCPEKFKDYLVIGLNVTALISGTEYRDQAKRFDMFIDFLYRHKNIILFIDEIHTIIGDGACAIEELNFAQSLKPHLTKNGITVIGATTTREYEDYLRDDAALSRRFRVVQIDEPSFEELPSMIRNSVAAKAKYHGISISRAMLEYIILISYYFESYQKNSDKILDLVDEAMALAKINGRKRVTKYEIKEIYFDSFDRFETMSLEQRKIVAYHEAGHYLVAKFLDILEITPVAVSIVPKGYTLGSTVIEDRFIDQVANIDYIIATIAFDLGGRVAEGIYSPDVTSEAVEDYKFAVEKAYSVVAKTAVPLNGDDSLESMMVYLDTEETPMLTERVKNILNEKVKQLIRKAYNLAEDLLKSHMDLLEAIVNALLENPIMSEKELSKICKKFED